MGNAACSSSQPMGNSTLAADVVAATGVACVYDVGADEGEEEVTPVLVGTVTIGARLDKALRGNAIR